MKNQIDIPLNKVRIGLFFLGAVVFVLLGALSAWDPEASAPTKSFFLTRTIGLISVSFFGIGGWFLGKKLFGSNVGLTIGTRGIIDQSSAVSVGLIEWKDITSIRRTRRTSSKLLVIKTNQPEKYISKASNRVVRAILKSNHKENGSPISIIGSSLKIDFDELESLLLAEWEKRKNSS